MECSSDKVLRVELIKKFIEKEANVKSRQLLPLGKAKSWTVRKDNHGNKYIIKGKNEKYILTCVYYANIYDFLKGMYKHRHLSKHRNHQKVSQKQLSFEK